MENMILNPSFYTKTPYQELSEPDLISRLVRAVGVEKSATLQVLEYLLEVDRRKSYAAHSYSSLFDFVVHHLGYSESQTAERISSMRLIREVPEVKGRLESGDLSLTTSAQIQRFLRNEKKFAGKELDRSEKLKVIERCANQSKREVEKILFQMQSEAARVESHERIRRVGDAHTELKFLVDEEVLSLLQGVRNLVGESSLGDIFKNALRGYVRELKLQKLHVDEEREVTPPAEWKTNSAAVVSRSTDRRYVPVVFRKMIYARSGGQCEFIDPLSKNRCQSRYKIQIDHIVPLGKGGKTELLNLRHLCPNHNQRAAYEWFARNDLNGVRSRSD